MSRGELPEGVPPDNRTKAFSAHSGARTGFAVPDTVTPVFETAGGLRDKDLAALARVVIEVEEEDENKSEKKKDDEDDKLIHGPHLPAQFLILIAIALVLAALAAYVLSQNQEPAPLCADLPHWNQFNCRAG